MWRCGKSWAVSEAEVAARGCVALASESGSRGVRGPSARNGRLTLNGLEPMQPGMSVASRFMAAGGLVVCAWGCATGGASRIPATSLPSCAVPTPAGEDWRQVVNEEFSFCVPSDWASSGSNGWRGDGGSIEWGYGEPRLRTRSVTTVTRVGDLPSPPPSPPGHSTRTTETIGGVPVDLWIIDLGGEILTGAQWTMPSRIHMTGEASSRRQAERQLEIVRTVRMDEGRR